MFSFGVILVELFCLFGSGMERVLVLSAARDGTLPPHLTRDHPQLAALAARCLEAEPAARPSAAELIECLSPLAESTCLPPLLQLADRTIAELKQLLAGAEARVKAQAAEIAQLRQDAVEREARLAAALADSDSLRARLAGAAGGAA